MDSIGQQWRIFFFFDEFILLSGLVKNGFVTRMPNDYCPAIVIIFILGCGCCDSYGCRYGCCCHRGNWIPEYFEYHFYLKLDPFVCSIGNDHLLNNSTLQFVVKNKKFNYNFLWKKTSISIFISSFHCTFSDWWIFPRLSIRFCHLTIFLILVHCFLFY